MGFFLLGWLVGFLFSPFSSPVFPVSVLTYALLGCDKIKKYLLWNGFPWENVNAKLFLSSYLL